MRIYATGAELRSYQKPDGTWGWLAAYFDMDSFKDGECVDPAVIAGSEAGLLIDHDDEQGFLSA